LISFVVVSHVFVLA